MSRKTFVLDTNVLLLDTGAIEKFPENNVVIPVTVLEELDKMKRLPNELGKNARAVIRFMDGLRRSNHGDMHTGLQLPNGSMVRILLEIKENYASTFATAVNDNKIIMAAYLLFEKGEKVVFVSKDLAARIKAEALGLEAQDYEQMKITYEELYPGIRYKEASKRDIDQFLKDGALPVAEEEYCPNEYCVLTSPENSQVVGKYDDGTRGLFNLLKTPKVWGLTPRNTEQRCAIDLMMRPDIKLVTLVGPAGTGKTLLALACGLRQVFDDGCYRRILVSRPIVPLGRDIGYLPGSKEEKLYHWMQPIYDNLEFLCASHDAEPNETMRWILDSHKLEMEAVTYIRGRSLPKMFIIIDEAQNLSPHEVKTIISRAGEDTKVILAGDPTQIDNPYLDKDSNGLTYVVNRFREQAIYGQMFLKQTERSDLAARAAALL